MSFRGEGWEAMGKTTLLKSVVIHPKLQGLPFIPEMPNELPGYKAEIEIIRSWMV